MPDDCDKTDRTFELLSRLTGHCFLDGNIPINSVAYRIRNDSGHLHYIIKKLEKEVYLKQDQSLDSHDDLNFSFDFVATKAFITTDDKWCSY